MTSWTMVYSYYVDTYCIILTDLSPLYIVYPCNCLEHRQQQWSVVGIVNNLLKSNGEREKICHVHNVLYALITQCKSTTK